MGHTDPHDWPDKPTKQAELKPCCVPGDGETGHAGDAGDEDRAWGTRRLQPGPTSLTLSISSSASSACLSPAHHAIVRCRIPVVGKARLIQQGEQKMLCTATPGFSCATLTVPRHLCTREDDQDLVGFTFHPEMPQGIFCSTPKEEKDMLLGYPGRTQGRAAATGSSRTCCVLCAAMGRQRPDPEELLCLLCSGDSGLEPHWDSCYTL